MTDICIYHGDCPDGLSAAWVFQQALGENIEFFPATHGQEPPDVADKDVFIVDFSYPLKTMLAMAKVANSITLLDHHKTAMDSLAATFPTVIVSDDRPLIALDDPELERLSDSHELPVVCQFDMNRSGAMLAWDFLYPGKRPPFAIKLIQDGDLYRHEYAKTPPFLAAICSYGMNLTSWSAQMRRPIDDMVDEGFVIVRHTKTQVQRIIAATERPMQISGTLVPVANAPDFLASSIGNALSAKASFSATYSDKPDCRRFSLRSRPDGADVAAIAQEYGGGGHKHAAGFLVPRNHPLAQG